MSLGDILWMSIGIAFQNGFEKWKKRIDTDDLNEHGKEIREQLYVEYLKYFHLVEVDV